MSQQGYISIARSLRETKHVARAYHHAQPGLRNAVRVSHSSKCVGGGDDDLDKVEKRVSDLNTPGNHHPFETVFAQQTKDPKCLEKYLQKLRAHRRSKGEYFDLSVEDAKEMQACLARRTSESPEQRLAPRTTTRKAAMEPNAKLKRVETLLQTKLSDLKEAKAAGLFLQDETQIARLHAALRKHPKLQQKMGAEYCFVQKTIQNNNNNNCFHVKRNDGSEVFNHLRCFDGRLEY